MKKIVVLFVLFGIALFMGASAANASLIENGDFELGLASWDHNPNVKAKGSWANIDPKSGERQAVMSPDGFLPSSLNMNFDSEGSHSVVISFDYNLWSFSSMGSEVGDDFVVSLISDDSTYFDEIFRVNFNDTISNGLTIPNGPTIQGWQNYEETFLFDTSMQLSLLFEVDNFKDPGQFGIGFIDNVEVSSVPIPGAICLLGSGLVGLIGIRIRRRNS